MYPPVERTFNDIMADLSATRVAWWKCNDASGGLVDETGNHNATEVGSPTYAQDPLRRGPGSSILNNVTSYFTTPDHADFAFGKEMTLSATIKTTTINDTIVSQYSSISGAWRFLVNSSGEAECRFDGIANVIGSGVTVNDGVEHVIDATVKDGLALLYVDGLLVDSNLGTDTNVAASTLDVQIGSHNSGSGEFVGNFQDIAIYSSAITAQQIAEKAAAHVRRLDSRYEDTTALWDAKHGTEVYALALDDTTKTTSDVGGGSVSFLGNLSQTYNSILTKGSLGVKSDGVDDRVNLGDMNSFFNSGGSFWISGYMKKDGSFFTLLENSLGGTEGLVVWISGSGRFKFQMYGGGSEVQAPTTAADDTWVRVDCWFDSIEGKIKARLNGGAVAESVSTGYSDDAAVMSMFGFNAGESKTGSLALLIIHDRIPATGEIEALYTASRTLVENFDTDSANNPDLTSTASYWAAHKVIPAVDNFMSHLHLDVNIATATQLDISPIAFVSDDAWESAARFPAYQSRDNGGIVVTGAFDSALHTVRSQIDHFQVIGLPWSFAADAGDGNAGVVVLLDGAETIIDSCPITFNGDIPVGGSNPTTFFKSTGTDGFLNNCLLIFNGDHDHATDPKVSGGVGFKQCTIVRFGAGSSDLQLGTTDLSNSAVFQIASHPGSVWKGSIELSGLDIDDTFGDAAGGDYSVKSTGQAYQTGIAIDGIFTDSLGTVWTVPASPNTSHLDTLFVGPPATGEGLVSGPSSIQSASGCSFNVTNEHLFE